MPCEGKPTLDPLTPYCAIRAYVLHSTYLVPFFSEKGDQVATGPGQILLKATPYNPTI